MMYTPKEAARRMRELTMEELMDAVLSYLQSNLKDPVKLPKN